MPGAVSSTDSERGSLALLCICWAGAVSALLTDRRTRSSPQTHNWARVWPSHSRSRGDISPLSIARSESQYRSVYRIFTPTFPGQTLLAGASTYSEAQARRAEHPPGRARRLVAGKSAGLGCAEMTACPGPHRHGRTVRGLHLHPQCHGAGQVAGDVLAAASGPRWRRGDARAQRAREIRAISGVRPRGPL